MPNTNVWFADGNLPIVVLLEPAAVAARLNSSDEQMVGFGGCWLNARLVTRLDPSPTVEEMCAARLAAEAKNDAEAEAERAFAYEKAEGLLPGDEGVSHGD